MIGSIIGDIVGSIYEWRNCKSKDFELFDSLGCYTDDTVMTIATADWLLNGGDVATYYGKWGNAYPDAGYGGSFREWLAEMKYKGSALSYNSCGNGCAMRVGPVGWAFSTEGETLNAAKISAMCTHDHPEGIKGAQAIAFCIFMARHHESKDIMRSTIEKVFAYNLDFTIDEIRPEYGWDSKYGNGVLCQASVPQAIVAFLDGICFEDCIRNAISIGGDSDTIGCMTGSIAEAYYGVPDEIRNKALEYLPKAMIKVIDDFESKIYLLNK